MNTGINVIFLHVTSLANASTIANAFNSAFDKDGFRPDKASCQDPPRKKFDVSTL